MKKKIHWQNKHANMLVRKCSEIVAISTFRRGTLFQRQRNQIKTNSTTSTFFIFFTTKLIRGRIKNLIWNQHGVHSIKIYICFASILAHPFSKGTERLDGQEPDWVRGGKSHLVRNGFSIFKSPQLSLKCLITLPSHH